MHFLTACINSGSTQAPEGSDAPALFAGEQTVITLTIGDVVLDADLNDSVPAQSGSWHLRKRFFGGFAAFSSPRADSL